MRFSFCHWARLWAVVLGAALLASPAWSFGTIDGLGQHSEHRRITVWALRAEGLGPATLQQLAGRGGFTFGAVGAPDNPWRGLINEKAAHCDGGDFLPVPDYRQDREAARAHLMDCRRWIYAHLDQSVTDAGALADRADAAPLDCRFDGRRRGVAKCLVLEDLGLVFHASQDFYAHSNWTDRTGGPTSATNPPGLGQAGPAPWLSRDVQAAFPDGLITGCYDGFPEVFHCGALSSRSRVQHRVLNKDEGPIDPDQERVGDGVTPRGRIKGNFQRAVDAAVQETRGKWAEFSVLVMRRYGAETGQLILCRLKADRSESCPA